jgi:hypothetical protein
MTIINTEAWSVYQYASRRADELFADYQKTDPGSSKAADLCAQSLAIRQLAIDILDEKHRN